MRRKRRAHLARELQELFWRVPGGEARRRSINKRTAILGISILIPIWLEVRRIRMRVDRIHLESSDTIPHAQLLWWLVVLFGHGRARLRFEQMLRRTEFRAAYIWME